MIDRSGPAAVCALLLFLLPTSTVLAEGSRSLYPASYPSASTATGARANLDLQPGTRYMNRVIRRGFIYVYARAGEYILLGSSNTGSESDYRGDINVYDPQDFGIPGDETLPAGADFTCTGGSSTPGPHYSGPDLGRIRSRAAELAGPNSADGSATVTGGYAPCAYRAPIDGIYGVLFTAARTGGGPNGVVNQVRRSTNSVAAWEVAVRNSASTLADLEGRVFTYAFLGFTGGNNRPVFSSLYYVTEDGYRYRQDLRGLDPNGYALYANTFGFLDDNEPLYKTLRSDSFAVDNLPLGVSAQPAEYPIFFSDIGPGGVAESEAEVVLGALDIPLEPPSPQIGNVGFIGALGGAVTSTGVGGTFRFSTTDTVSYEIVISRDGLDFDAATPGNRVLTGIAYTGLHEVAWDGLDNNRQPFPASATPYPYRAYGRNGEVHFPIIDAENNGLGTVAVPGGGPTIIRLNGADPDDSTVFFDDRGYVTRSGELIGNLNGTLCPGPTPAAADPPVSLAGVDSRSDYRRWQNGSNRNSDCNPTAGWGDAKGVNLWTYFLTPQFSAVLEVREFPVDVATSVTVVDTAEPGDLVQGSFSYANNGTATALEVSYEFSLQAGLGGVVFGNLPPGASASYNPADGAVTFAGFPAQLAPGERFNDLTFRYIAPASGPVTVATGISTTSQDEFPDNDSATGTTVIGAVDVAVAITGVPATASPGAVVNGSVLFSNLGTGDAVGVTYGFAIGTPGNTPGNVQFYGLPNGVGASFDAASGAVSLTGMPDMLVAGDVVSLSFSYTAPASDGSTTQVEATIGASGDADSTNNDAAAETVFRFPPDASLVIDAQSVCIQDAPYIAYDVTALNFTPTSLATVEFLGSDGSVIQTLTDQPLTGARLLWPEAATDPDGNGVAWPGWTFDGSDWQPVPSLVRPALTVRISVNPTAEATVFYPQSTADCNTDPPGADLPGGPVEPGAPWPPEIGAVGNATTIPTLQLPLLAMLSLLTLLVGARQLRGSMPG